MMNKVNQGAWLFYCFLALEGLLARLSRSNAIEIYLPPVALCLPSDGERGCHNSSCQAIPVLLTQRQIYCQRNAGDFSGHLKWFAHIPKIWKPVVVSRTCLPGGMKVSLQDKPCSGCWIGTFRCVRNAGVDRKYWDIKLHSFIYVDAFHMLSKIMGWVRRQGHQVHILPSNAFCRNVSWLSHCLHK